MTKMGTTMTTNCHRPSGVLHPRRRHPLRRPRGGLPRRLERLAMLRCTATPPQPAVLGSVPHHPRRAVGTRTTTKGRSLGPAAVAVDGRLPTDVVPLQELDVVGEVVAADDREGRSFHTHGGHPSPQPFQVSSPGFAAPSLTRKASRMPPCRPSRRRAKPRPASLPICTAKSKG